MSRPHIADLTRDLLSALHTTAPVAGLTHNFYRYPARFSPEFVKAAIRAFSQPCETVFDPFVGGGTVAVEALACGRRFVGCDINPLATFIARVKTTPLSRRDVCSIRRWAARLSRTIDGRITPGASPVETINVPWWLKNALHQSVDALKTLDSPEQVRFARCTLLRTAQWALDCRSEIPTVREFVAKHSACTTDMLNAIESLGAVVASGGREVRILTRSAVGVEKDRRIPGDWLPPRLILTSPPYPGVHILYHRWQLQGRRETPAPYWLAGCHDGHGASYYTFGGRNQGTLAGYMKALRECFASIAAVMDSDSLILQLVAFPHPVSQLPAYLDTLTKAGLKRCDVLPEGAARLVPNRKWYTAVTSPSGSNQEVLLAHVRSS